MAELFSWISALLMAFTQAAYFYNVVKGNTTPNPATWIILVAMSLLNTVSYFQVTDGSFLKTASTVVATCGVVVIFCYALRKGKFVTLGLLEWSALAFSVLVIMAWKLSGNEQLANLLVQLVFVTSYIPTILGLVQKQTRENPLPWALAVSSYAFLMLVVVIEWSEHGWVELVYPVVNGILGNGTVAVIAFLRSKET